jgi:hypothetical protein
MIRIISLKKMRYAGCMEQVINAYKTSVGKYEGKRLLRRVKRGINDKIKIYASELHVRMMLSGFVSFRAGSQQRAVMNTVTKVWVP